MGTRIKIVIGVAVVVVLVIVAVLLLSGGDDDSTPKRATATPTTTSDDAPASEQEPSDDDASSSEPALRTLVVGRGEGKNATAQAGKLINDPGEIWIRVSVAPKREVRVTWSLACGGKTASQDNYLTTPPHLRQLKVPKNAQTCAASVAGQIAETGGSGRLKVAVLRDR